jgi:pectate lyase
MEVEMKSRRFLPNAITGLYVFVLLITIAPQKALCREERPNSEKYLKAVQNFADTVIEKGRDTYGNKHTPLFIDGLHAKSLKPVIWKKDGQSWLLSNFASQQPLIRTLDGLSTLTGDTKYRQAAVDATRYALKHLQSPNGLFYWGGHLAWDLEQERRVGQYAGIHEMKGHQPYYRLIHTQIDGGDLGHSYP